MEPIRRHDTVLLLVASLTLLAFSLLAFVKGQTSFGLFLATCSVLGAYTPFSRADKPPARLAPSVWIGGGLSFVVAGALSAIDGGTILAIISLALGSVISLTMVTFLVLRYVMTVKNQARRGQPGRNG